MSLTITIDRIEGDLFRAEVAGHPRLVIEHDDLSGLVEGLKQTLDLRDLWTGRLTVEVASP